MKKAIVSVSIVGLSLASNSLHGFRHDSRELGHSVEENNRALENGFGIGRMIADENDNEFGVKQCAEFVAKHHKAIKNILKAIADENDDELGFKKDMKKAGHFYEKHSGAINGAITTAAQVGKTIFGDENDNELGFKNDMKKAGHFYENHSGAINGAITTAAQVGKTIFGDENDDELGIKQRAEFVAKHHKAIKNILKAIGDENDDELGFKNDMKKAGHFYEDHSGAINGAITTAAQVGKTIFGDENDDELGIKQRAEFVAKHHKAIENVLKAFGDENDDELGFKKDMKKAGHFYENHSGAINGAITTAAQVGKTIFGDENDDELGIKQRAEFVAKHHKAIESVLKAIGDENDDELGFKKDMKKAGHFYEKHSGAINGAITTAAKVGKTIFGDENDNELGFKKDMDKVGHFYEKHSGAINGAITTAAQVGKTIFGDENDEQEGFVPRNFLGF